VGHFYFDYNATTPLSPEVIESLRDALENVYGNASSIHHFGQESKRRFEAARRQTAAWLGCHSQEMVFTSGGTEANNLALFGIARQAPPDRRHIITTEIEHPAVLNPCHELEREGFAVTWLQVDGRGLVDPEAVKRAIRPDTLVISVMHANNETGVVQPVAEIAAIAKEAGAIMHSDGVQAAGKIGARPSQLGVDLYAISAHKLSAPKGTGALYVRKGVKLSPILFGGHHERDRRAGTENVPGAVALGQAAAWLQQHLTAESARISALRDRLEHSILGRIPDAGVNGAGATRLPNTTNIYFDGVEGEAIVIALDLLGFAVSSGSACSSGAVEPSHVLLAMGLPPERARSSIRFSLGRWNTEDQVDRLIDAVEESVARLRRLSPVYTAHA
jgi:cysteine desulfurase